MKNREERGTIGPGKVYFVCRDRPNSEAPVSNGRLGHKRAIEPNPGAHFLRPRGARLIGNLLDEACQGYY